MSKTKMRCITCSKWFQSANAKEVTCPDCTLKARKEKQAAKNAPPSNTKPAGIVGQPANSLARPPIQSKPKTNQGGTNQWLDRLDDVKIAQPDQPLQRPKFPSPPAQRNNRDTQAEGIYNANTSAPNNRRDDRNPGPSRGPAAYRVNGDTKLSPTIGQRPRQPMENSPIRTPYKPWQKDQPPGASGPKPKPRVPKAPTPPKQKREKTLPPPPFVPTEEQTQQVEERYIELAIPAEFDGIRTQIAQELSIPKKAVKKIIKDLRSRQSIPSWWELQTYKGSNEDLEKIKAVYEPYLPTPPVGIHKKIADELTMKPGIIYQAIKTIRQELKLPQYNNPSLHEELKPQSTTNGTSAPAPELALETASVPDINAVTSE